jgi:hypothetical protein
MRLSDSLALLRHYYIVRKSGLFDGDYYREANGPLRHKILPSLAHFLVEGGAAGRSPHPLFDSGWYLTQNPGIKAKSANPLVHYLLRGARQGCDPNPYFDTKWYLAHNKDVAQAGMNPLVHYLKHGAAEGRDPSPKFDTQWYVGVYKDVAKAGINPLAHFLRYGRAEGHRAPTPGEVLVTSTSNIVMRHDGSLEFINTDPQLHLSIATRAYTNQLCLMLSLHVEAVGGDYLEPRLYLDYGDGIRGPCFLSHLDEQRSLAPLQLTSLWLRPPKTKVDQRTNQDQPAGQKSQAVGLHRVWTRDRGEFFG